MVHLFVYYRTGPSWKEGRTAAGNQIKPRNVFSYTAGLNSVAASFTEYLKSAKDENHRISDISMPLRRLLMDSKIVMLGLCSSIIRTNPRSFSYHNTCNNYYDNINSKL